MGLVVPPAIGRLGLIIIITNVSKAKENNFTNSKRRWASVLMWIKWIIHVR